MAVVIGGNILSLLLGAYMNGGLMLFLLKLARGEGAEIADIFRGGRYFGRMLLSRSVLESWWVWDSWPVCSPESF